MFTRVLFLLIILSISMFAKANNLYKVQGIDLDSADFYLFDILDENKLVARSVDAYFVNGNYYIAITPLFEALRLKYKLNSENLIVEVDGQSSTYTFSSELSLLQNDWLTDGVFTFINLETLKELFKTSLNVDTGLLSVSLSGHEFDFPYKSIQKQKKQRATRNIFYTPGRNKNKADQTVTIPDKYRLATAPNGFIKIDAIKKNDGEDSNVILQTVSDFLYHSTNVTVFQRDDETTSRVSLARYPQYKGDKILGVWDQYRFGDVYSRGSQLQDEAERGFGITFTGNKQSGQHENMVTSIAEDAPPGWEADLYHNNVYLKTVTVPNDGLLLFDDLTLNYGTNLFKIILYGPYGEEREITKNISAQKNALSAGSAAYTLRLIDQDTSMFDLSPEDVDFNTISAGVEYGVTDNWTLGTNLSFNQNEGNEAYSVKLKNQISLPSLLFENNFSYSGVGDYRQYTTLATSVLGNDSLSFNYRSEGGNELDDSYSFSSYYNLFKNGWLVNFGVAEDKDEDTKVQRISNRISKQLGLLSLTNVIDYSETSIFGARASGMFSIGGRINQDFRVTVNLPYDIKNEDPLLEETSVSFQYRYKDSNDNRHTFSLNNQSAFHDNNWTAKYNVAWIRKTHQFTFRSQYNSQDRWQLSAGLLFYFGFDYYNNRPVLSSKNIQNSGTLDVHAYLDRHMNGVPDILDYNLSNVGFSGNPKWMETATNDNGRARLFGAATGASHLKAVWQDGSNTINQDFTVYSHPGSVNKVNLPFYLTTELETSVFLDSNGEVLPLMNARVEAVNMSNGEVYESESDSDGYLLFEHLTPGYYEVQVSQSYLREKDFTTDVVGFTFHTSLKGGFIQLPSLTLMRIDSEQLREERLSPFELTHDNSDTIINTDDKNLIHLPPKGASVSPHSSEDIRNVKFYKVNRDVNMGELTDLEQVKSASSHKKLGLGKLNIELAKSSNKKAFSLFVGEFESIQMAKYSAELQGLSDAIIAKGISSTGQIIYRYELRSFSEEIEAREFAAENYKHGAFSIEVKDAAIDLSSGWVIQFAASSDKSDFTNLIEKMESIEYIYVARKVVNGDYWYCLISQVFNDKQKVQQYLDSIEFDGFLVEAKRYMDTVWRKN